MTSYYRKCKHCGQLIQLRQMPEGQWVAFEDYQTVHSCEDIFGSFSRNPRQARFGPDSESQEGIRTIIDRAIREKLVLKISYVSRYRGYPHRTIRKVEPVKREGRLIRAYCRLRSDGRTFRLDRIQKAELTGEEFSTRRRMKTAKAGARTTYRPPSQRTNSPSQRTSTTGCLVAMFAVPGTVLLLSIP